MEINRTDVFWNYAATFLKIAASALLLPFILRLMPAETVGIWSVFMAITSLVGLLDFGFNPSFARNVTYIFSGVRKLSAQGFSTVNEEHARLIDYGLLKGVISAMKWFYLRVAIILFFVLVTLGTYYIKTLLQKYHGNHREVYIAWALFCAITTYNLFTLYYEALLQGNGLVKKSKQIIIVGQLVYLIIAAILIISGSGLVAIIAAQAVSVIIIRLLSYKAFFTREIKASMSSSVSHSKEEILKAIYPNAFKIGLTMLGGIMVQRSAMVIGSLFLGLEEIASYGITMQLVFVVGALAEIYVATYQPKIVQLRVENNLAKIKELYIKGQIVLFATYFICGLGLVFLGAWGLSIIGSQTLLLQKTIITLAIVVSFLGSNHAVAGNMILTKNEVPFFKAALFSGAATIILLLLFFSYTSLGIVSMILAPGIAQGVYQNWKWPLVVKNELGISYNDVSRLFKRS